MQDGLDKVHCPYSYGYSIILLTLLVKVVTFPLTKQQVCRSKRCVEAAAGGGGGGGALDCSGHTAGRVLGIHGDRQMPIIF